MANLQNRRSSSSAPSAPSVYSPAGDYKMHLSKIKIGKRVLDVGCGDMNVKKHLPKDVIYLGVDAFPVNDEVYKMRIEDCKFKNNSFDTVIAFAVLDGLQDLSMALHHMKRICKKNILFLTGVGILPDEFHTLIITEEKLIALMSPFKLSLREELAPKTLLMEFKR